MEDFWNALKFLRIVAWAHDGLLAKVTVRAAEYRRYPRGFDAPDDVRYAIGRGELCQRHLERGYRLFMPRSFLVKRDGTIEFLP